MVEEQEWHTEQEQDEPTGQRPKRLVGPVVGLAGGDTHPGREGRKRESQEQESPRERVGEFFPYLELGPDQG